MGGLCAGMMSRTGALDRTSCQILVCARCEGEDVLTLILRWWHKSHDDLRDLLPEDEEDDLALDPLGIRPGVWLWLWLGLGVGRDAEAGVRACGGAGSSCSSSTSSSCVGVCGFPWDPCDP